MSDHADVIRDVLVTVKQTASNHGLASNAAKAIHALDAERLDAEAEIADTEASLRRMYDRAKAAEARVTELLEAAMALYERVQMDESVGICLSERVTTLALGAALAREDAIDPWSDLSREWLEDNYKEAIPVIEVLVAERDALLAGRASERLDCGERLDAAEAERDDKAKQISELVRTARSEQVRADKAEAERDEAREVLEGSHARGYREGVREMEARVTELEAARSEILRNSEIERKALQAERDGARRERDKALLSVEGLSKRLTIAVAAEAERDEARRLLREVVKADRQDTQMGYPIPGDSCMGAFIGLVLMQYLDGLAAPTKEDGA